MFVSSPPTPPAKWSVKTGRAPSRHWRDAMVYGHTTTAMHDEYTPHPNPNLFQPNLIPTQPNPIPTQPSTYVLFRRGTDRCGFWEVCGREGDVFNRSGEGGGSAGACLAGNRNPQGWEAQRSHLACPRGWTVFVQSIFSFSARGLSFLLLCFLCVIRCRPSYGGPYFNYVLVREFR